MQDPHEVPASITNTELTRLTPSSRVFHIALRVEDCIVVLGGVKTCKCRTLQCTCTGTILPLNEVWVYNLYTDQWSKYLTPPDNETPKNVEFEKGVVIGEDIYPICMGRSNGEYTYTLWILRNPLDKSAVCWEKVQMGSQDQQPSPRDGYGCWAYGGKLWIFGGEGLDDNGDRMDEYNNELISFDPATKTWCTQECSGNIPSPRASFCSDIMDDKIWLFGGGNTSESDDDLDHLYTLHMDSEPYVWTRILTSIPAALNLLFVSSFTAVNNSVVWNGISDKETRFVMETWIFYLPSGFWRLHSRSDEMRNDHVSCKGLNNDVIVIGGNIYKGTVDTSTGNFRLVNVEGNFLHHIVPQPKSLLQLALKAIYIRRNILPWNDPQNVPQLLISRVQELLHTEP